jgi:ketosteroid isomerase-like protein
MIANLSRVLGITCLVALCACSGDDEATGEALASGEEAMPSAETTEGSADVLPLADQITVIEDRLEATNTRDWDRWQALHTSNAIRTAPELAEPLQGASAMRAAIEGLSLAFPDYHLELQQAFGQGEWLAVRLHTTGTMTGPLTLSDGTELPATGQPIEQDWSALVRFEGDRISEFHEFYDQLTLLMQLGLVSL